MGNNYNLSSKIDSAFICYFKALEVVEDQKYTSLRMKIIHNIGVTYMNTGKYLEAKKLFRESIPLVDNDYDRAKLYSTLGITLIEEAKLDSADHYLQESLKLYDQETNPYELSIVYNALSSLNEQEGDYSTALNYERQYSHHLNKALSENEHKHVLEIQKKYEHQKAVNSNNRLYINRQRATLISVVILFAVIIASILIVSHYYSRLKEKEQNLAEAEDRIQDLVQMAQSFNKKKNTFRNKLLEHFDILKKAAVLEAYMKDEDIKQGKNLLKKFNEIVYKQQELDWDVLYEAMNQLNDNFLENLKDLVPDLDDDEFRICCMIFSDFTNQEIALIMKLSNSTITHKRSSIRRKMQIEDYGNISDFLKKRYKKTLETT